MDPFSLASGIAGLVGVIATTVSTVYQYGSSVIGASKAQREFLRELRTLQIPLAKLEDIVSTADASLPTYPHISTELVSILGECRKDVEELLAVLQEKLEAKKLKNTLHRLSWPFSEKETLDKIQKLSRYQSLFQNALTIDTWNLVSLTFSEVVTIKNNQQAAQKDLKFQQVLEWLSEFAGDYQTKHNDVLLKRISNTGEWLLDSPEFRGFTQGKDEFKSLWCYGLPGAGKTYLSCAVIDRISSKLDRTKGAVVYWYFDYLRASEHNPNLICASLLKQLVEGLTALPASIEELYDSNKGSKKGPDKAALMRAMRSLLADLEQSFVVVDALDECPGRFLKDHLAVVSELQEMGACVFITSRQPEHPEGRSSEWVSFEIRAHVEDVRCLVDERLQDNCSGPIRKYMTDGFKKEIAETIISKTNGMFLWASMQVEEVSNCRTVTKVREALRNMPKGISEFFSRILSRVANDDFALRTLFWLVHAKIPLSFDALSHGLSIELENGALDDIDRDNIPCIEVLVEACRGLAIIDSKRNLRLAHFSIQEYLKNNPQMFEPLNCFYIAKVCLRYLSMGVFTSVCNYDDTKEIRRRMRDYPLLEYAAKTWRCHLSQEIQPHEIKSEILNLYSHEGLFSNYIQVYQPWWPRYTASPEQMEVACHSSYRDPLYNAVELQLPEVVDHLLNGKGLSSETSARSRALIIAVRDNRKDLVDMLLKAGVDPSIPNHVPEASEWTIFKDANYSDSERQPVIEPFQEKERIFYGKWYPSTLAIILGYRDIFEMLRYMVNIDVIGDILTKAVEEWHGGEEIVKEILREYPEIDHRHPAYVQALEGGKWIWNPIRGKLLQCLLDARPQLDDQDGILTKLLPLVVLNAPECVATILERGAGPNTDKDMRLTSLSAAIHKGDEQLAKLFMDRGADLSIDAVSRAARNGMNGLIGYMLDKGYDIGQNCDVSVASAVEMGHIDTLLLLLSRGANVESVGVFMDWTALQIAVSNGDDNIARILLENGANPNADSENGGTPLVIASRQGNEKMITLLIDNGAMVNFVSIHKHDTALCMAAASGSLEVCRLLLLKGANPNLGRGTLPLLSVLNSRVTNLSKNEIIEMLLENGARPMARNYKQEYPLECAVYLGLDDIVRLFLKYGASLDSRGSKGSILHAAAASGNKNMVRIMLDLGAKVIETKDKFGGVLHWAHPEDYQILIQHGANVNMLGRRYGTAIQAAIVRMADLPDGQTAEGRLEKKIFEAIFSLIKAGSDVNAIGGFYGSAIQAASSRDYKRIVALLFLNGAAINAVGGRCGTALQAAAYHGYTDMVNTLIHNGADVNQKAGLYGTALQAAAFGGRVGVVELLLQHGADVKAQGGKYGNALAAAKRTNLRHYKMVQDILLRHGAVDDDREYDYDWIWDSDDYDKSSDTFNYDGDDDENED